MMPISESILWRGRVNGEVPTLPVGFEADDADHDMTPFLRRCITNRANVFQRWVLLSHFSLIRTIHHRERIKTDHPTFVSLTLGYFRRLGVVGFRSPSRNWHRRPCLSIRDMYTRRRSFEFELLAAVLRAQEPAAPDSTHTVIHSNAQEAVSDVVVRHMDQSQATKTANLENGFMGMDNCS